jgi:hypothetical protein
MSVILNQAALDFLLQNPAGPVGQDLRRRCENITPIYRDNVAVVLPEFFESGGDIDFTIFVGDQGLQATIGIRGRDADDRWANYLAAKVEKEPDKATSALEQGLHT